MKPKTHQTAEILKQRENAPGRSQDKRLRGTGGVKVRLGRASLASVPKMVGKRAPVSV